MGRPRPPDQTRYGRIRQSIFIWFVQASAMTVSIILTSYNRPHLLARAISSVKAQTYTDFQLIAVDDGSSDPFVEATILNMVEEPSLHLFLQPTDREPL